MTTPPLPGDGTCPNCGQDLNIVGQCPLCPQIESPMTTPSTTTATPYESSHERVLREASEREIDAKIYERNHPPKQQPLRPRSLRDDVTGEAV